MTSCTMTLGDFIYHWDCYTNLLTRNRKGEKEKRLVAYTIDPSALQTLAMQDFRR